MIKVLSSGLYTSLQDLGRFGYRAFGVPVSGAMDGYSAQLANQLLGNTEDCAVMEFTFTGPVLEFSQATSIAITGAAFTPMLNNSEIPLNTLVDVPEGSLLKFGLASFGLRGYLAVAGGFVADRVLGSYSYYPGITQQPVIVKGDELQLQDSFQIHEGAHATVKVPKLHLVSSEIDAVRGPEFELLPEAAQKQLIDSNFTIAPESNRMAYLLDASEELSGMEILTAPVQPGTVQLTPSGKTAVLMRDAQTTGGYARVLQLSEKSLNRLAQKRAGEVIQFILSE